MRGDARRGDAEVAPTFQVREVFTLTLNRKDRKDGPGAMEGREGRAI